MGRRQVLACPSVPFPASPCLLGRLGWLGGAGGKRMGICGFTPSYRRVGGIALRQTLPGVTANPTWRYGKPYHVLRQTLHGVTANPTMCYGKPYMALRQTLPCDCHTKTTSDRENDFKITLHRVELPVVFLLLDGDYIVSWLLTRVVLRQTLPISQSAIGLF
jgi:hypothetical protein